MKKIFLISVLSLFIYNFSCDSQEINNVDDDISTSEIDMLKHMREEEKLARDVYDYFYDKYELRVFGNIMQSEKTHMNSVMDLLNYYGIEDPATQEIGVFKNEALQQLYDTLIAQGDQSLVDALKVGATIEDIDIYDLVNFSQQTDNQNILKVFSNLTCGSRNHMRAFTRNLSNYGINYEPQYISQELYEDIVNSSQEQCGRVHW